MNMQNATNEVPRRVVPIMSNLMHCGKSLGDILDEHLRHVGQFQFHLKL